MQNPAGPSENNTDNANTTSSWSDWAGTFFSCTPNPPQISNRALHCLFACSPGILPQTVQTIV